MEALTIKSIGNAFVFSIASRYEMNFHILEQGRVLGEKF